MLKHSEARTIAESNWGRGGTHSYPTNRRGAFYFGCSGHGGFVIDCEALSAEEAQALLQFASVDTYDLYVSGSKRRVMFPERSRGFRMPFDCTKTRGAYFLLEEDCAWALAYVLTDIRIRPDQDQSKQLESARLSVARWYPECTISA